LACGLLFAAANGLALRLVRRTPRRRPLTRIASQGLMIGSLGALASGPPLAGVYVAVGLPLWPAGGASSEVVFVAGGAAALAVGFGSILWGWLVGQRRLQVEVVEIPLPGLPRALEGLLVAHISDLHIGNQLHGPMLRGFVDRVNALRPDLVVITGDIFDFDASFIEEGCHALAKLSAPHGVYGVLGNHDVYTGAEAVAEGIRSLTPIRLLRDEWTRIRIEGEALYLLGIDDPGRAWSERDARSPEIERLAAEVPADAPRILLAHRPSFFRQAAEVGLPVVLSGHTHGGQIALPGPAKHWNVSRLIAHFTRGLFHQGGSVLYVNRGLGVAGPPVRLNCPREIALLRLVPRARSFEPT
jgi:predicted MPP superfamily phosphohydrolase